MRLLSSLLKRDKVCIDSDQVVYPQKVKVKKEKQENKAPAPKPVQSDAEVKRLVENAKKKAEYIISSAQTEAVKIEEQASEKGYKKGYSNGLEQAKKECQNKLSDIASLMKKLDRDKAKFYADIESETVDLAMKIVEKVIAKKLEDDKDIFLSLYRKAIKDISKSKWIKLTIDKSQVQFVTSNSEYLLSMVTDAERIEVEVDEDAPKGTCIVETSDKIVDSSVYTQIELLKNAIVNAQ